MLQKSKKKTPEQKEAINDAARRRYAANGAKIRAKNRAYYVANREMINDRRARTRRELAVLSGIGWLNNFLNKLPEIEAELAERKQLMSTQHDPS
jgi:hypothetical protein